jgi:hypothetical protein
MRLASFPSFHPRIRVTQHFDRMNTRDNHRHRNLNRGSSSKRSGQISRTTGTTINSTEHTQLQDTTTIRNGPSYPNRSASSGSRHDSFPPPSTSLNPHPLKRNKSSPSTSMHADDNRPTNANEPHGLRDSGTFPYRDGPAESRRNEKSAVIRNSGMWRHV